MYVVTMGGGGKDYVGYAGVIWPIDTVEGQMLHAGHGLRKVLYLGVHRGLAQEPTEGQARR